MFMFTDVKLLVLVKSTLTKLLIYLDHGEILGLDRFTHYARWIPDGLFMTSSGMGQIFTFSNLMIWIKI